MNIERAMEFLVKNQARMDARFNDKFDRADKRLERLERVVAQNNRVVSRLSRYGVSLRSDVRRLDKAMVLLAERHTETDDKLNGLIDLMDRRIRGNGQQG
jgi:uncharacterized coiled-coil protein SlyX